MLRFIEFLRTFVKTSTVIGVIVAVHACVHTLCAHTVHAQVPGSTMP